MDSNFIIIIVELIISGLIILAIVFCLWNRILSKNKDKRN